MGVTPVDDLLDVISMLSYLASLWSGMPIWWVVIEISAQNLLHRLSVLTGSDNYFTGDIQKTVNFARTNKMRITVQSTGHSFLGKSFKYIFRDQNFPSSLGFPSFFQLSAPQCAMCTGTTRQCPGGRGFSLYMVYAGVPFWRVSFRRFCLT